ncbi:MAG: bifunctional alpha,alpha-trehalose-phosphate synthase (UDP-forming)/trehalose-phosphatase [Luteitalea sp.]|nr:bifunctional alpha,alpha-trehalose-phosphate synthase (UDP-forming)/trehalose-phosphatase [Luteitalea sp.]
MPRVLIVSNRLPITTEVTDEAITFTNASGGLATGLRGAHERSGGLWIGWPGIPSPLPEPQRAQLAQQLRDRGIVPVHLTGEELREYYEDFSNGVVWPLFHYLLDRLPLGPTAWETYRRINQRFADETAASYQPGDVIWVHDYQLMLVPGMLRQRLPDARIGFFLHIPFPAAEIFRILPWRREILQGLLGADLVGFHTYSYLQHFSVAVGELAGMDPEDDGVWLDERRVQFGVFPMGVDAEYFRQLATSTAVLDASAELISQAAGRTIFLGVDRLDYTKGIPRRLMAFEALLRDDPSLHDRVRLVQVAVPSRETVASYQDFRKDVEELIGRINGAYGTLSAVPIHYLYQSVAPEQLVALYRAADVMLVTPLRDGMNLVAKEYVASRVDDDGVLVLSEFAGAVDELREAVVVNAYDVDGLTAAMRQALEMPLAERRERMRAMRRRVAAYDVHRWANHFVGALSEETPSERRAMPEVMLRATIARLRELSPLAILLDYDGTLVPIARTPAEAGPDAELLELIAALTRRPDTMVLLVSGRARDTLDSWFGQLSIELWAEHGVWHKRTGPSPWIPALPVPGCEWMEATRTLMEEFALATPGAVVETKSSSIAWHYRLAGRGLGRAQARELRVALSRSLVGSEAEIIEGKKVLEVRPRGATKAAVVQNLLSRDPSPAGIVAFGDDRTDEEMFAALPSNAVDIHVGPGASLAKHRLRHPAAVRTFLTALLN